MKIEVLGSGCAKCKKLAENAKDAVEMLGIEAEIIKIEDLNKIMNYGVMITPGLALDGEVKSTGKVLSVEAIKKMISESK
ncbi:MAG: thioredoxin family protein [Thermodesulfobacteriota bacterium]|nr:thioredoxin family protein [Thermodesulfobacteriota bacterium]